MLLKQVAQDGVQVGLELIRMWMVVVRLMYSVSAEQVLVVLLK